MFIFSEGGDYVSQDYYGVNWSYGFEHHGVKGQKWGVRRKLKRAGTAIINRGGKLVKAVRTRTKTAQQRRREAREAKKKKSNEPVSLVSKDHAAGHSKKPVERMTNAELQAMVTRLTLENNYRTQKNMQEAAAKGKSNVDKALETLDKLNKGITTVNNTFASFDKLSKMGKKDKKDDKKSAGGK